MPLTYDPGATSLRREKVRQLGWVDLRKRQARHSLDDESLMTQTGVHMSPPTHSPGSQDTMAGAFGPFAGVAAAGTPHVVSLRCS